MKLFVWENCKAIAQYGLGTAFALANSVDEAIASILDKFKHDSEGEWNSENYYIYFKEELNNTQPDIYESTVGFYIYGSA